MKLLSLFLVALCLCCVGFTQMNLMPTGLTGKIVLLGLNEVKREVRLTSDQDKKVQKLFKSAQEDFASLGLPDMHYMTRGLDKKLDQILESAQLQRLGELFLQVNGLLTLSEADVCSSLGISDTTKSEVQKLIKQHDREAMSKLMDVQKTRKLDKKKLDESIKKINESLNLLLTDDERTKWKVLQGKPFKFPKLGR